MQGMAHLLLVGAWQQAPDLLAALVADAHLLTWGSVDSAGDFDAAILWLEPTSLGQSWSPPACSWLGWNSVDDPALTLLAYGGHAMCVLPSAAPAALLVASVRRLLASQGGRTGHAGVPAQASPSERPERFLAHEALPTIPDHVLEVVNGVVAQYMLHTDGVEALLGLYGPGQWLPSHPEDDCSIQLRAHSAVLVRWRPWRLAVAEPACANQLRHRIWQMEAWLACQARPVLEDRILGMLQLLAEQFGRVRSDGVLLDVRITHAQLASAVGASRTTVTRLLTGLRKRRLLGLAGSGSAERYLLPHRPPTQHIPH